MNEDLEMLRIFYDGCQEHLDTMEMAVLDLERDYHDLSIVNQIFRSAHSIKGDARVIGHGIIESLTHEIENALSAIRSGKITVNKSIIDTLLLYIDQVRAALSLLNI